MAKKAKKSETPNTDETTEVVPSGPAKVVTLRCSVGTDDGRTMPEFIADLKEALGDVKNVTVLSERYVHGGQSYSLAEWETRDG